MHDKVFTPKKIIVVVPDEDLVEKLNAEGGLLEQLRGVGHEILDSFKSYNEALLFFVGNHEYGADTILVTKPRDEKDEEIFGEMLRSFDSLPVRPDVSDYGIEESKIVIALHHFSISFPETRFQEWNVTESIKLPNGGRIDHNYRTESRVSDYKIDLHDLTNNFSLPGIVADIGSLFRGLHQMKKELDLRKAYGEIKDGTNVEINQREIKNGDTPVIYS